ncbi:MAG: fasciclin domain-containing protein [Prolixibacteraceae bacterium]|nr:fasciclin domain-containing protein [Prolixibacteraceae bacterium]
MKLSLKFLIMVASVSLLAGCDSAKEEQYKRPEWLAPPIYQQLQEKGNFSHYLACIDKAGYAKTLQGAGYYTVFAPTDEAFSAFFTVNGLNSVSDISVEMAKDLVSYSLAVSPASYEQIDDYQNSSATASEESKTNVAFKRTTYNYKWVYTDFDVVSGEDKTVIDMNAVESEVSVPGGFEENDYNQKNIPFFTSGFMTKAGLSSYDYNYFYPNSELSGFNVAGAKVLEQDLWAENGIIHVIDKVILPLDNLEEILTKTNECSEFKDILSRYLVTYTKASDNFQLKYEQASGNSDVVFIKDYPYCSFAPNCENYLKYGGGTQMDAQTDGWTMFAPSNQALQDFYSNKFFKYGYHSLDEMPSFVIQELVNAHLFRTTVWPSKFSTTGNPYGEEARFDAGSDVFKKEIGSNGIFYAVNKVQNTDAFNTVLGDVILNPEYSLMYQALTTLEPLVSTLKNTASNYILFLITNEAMAEAGFKFNSASLAWEFTEDADRPDLGSHVTTALARFINMHIVLTTSEMRANGIDIKSGSGLIKTYGDEYIKYKDGTVYAGGNEAARRPKVTNPIESGSKNGQSYALNRALLFSNGNIGDVMSVSSLTSGSRATTLLRYLEKISEATYVNDEGVITFVPNCVYNISSLAIKDVPNTDVITVFVPNDPAIEAAVADGLLKPLANFAPDGDINILADDNVILEQFVKYHIVKGNIILGHEVNSSYVTYKKLDDGTYATLQVQGSPGSPGSLTVTDNQGRTANVITTAPSTYNILGNRAIVHVIDNYLTY